MIDINISKKLLSGNGEFLVDINLKIGQGEFVALTGPSGAGKTSILNMIAGLMDPDSGHIIYKGKTWLSTQEKINLKPQLRGLGFLFQEYALFPNMTIKENLVYALEDSKEQEYITELIEVMELGDLQMQKPNFLSGGQQQRAALARSLVRKPELLLLDEPMSALDSETSLRIEQYLKEVHQRYGLTTVVISHKKEEVLNLATQLVQIDQGKIIAQGKPTNFFPTNKKENWKVGKVVSLNNDSYVVSFTEGEVMLDQAIVGRNKKVGDTIRLQID